jgi:AraC-like DNA-binding protein
LTNISKSDIKYLMNLYSFFSHNLVENNYSDLHSHQYTEFVLCLGSGGYIADENNVKSEYNDLDITIHKPFAKHICFNGKQCTHFCLGVKGIELEEFPDTIINSNEKITSLFHEISEEIKNKNDLYIQISEAKTIEIVFYIKRFIECKMKNVSANNNVVWKIKNMIDDNFQKEINLSTISENVFLSEEYLRHLFKDEYGVSPIKYLIQKRVDHAKILLIETSKTIKELSYDCGFSDEHYFSKLFKKMTGLSPVQFRTNNIKLS